MESEKNVRVIPCDKTNAIYRFLSRFPKIYIFGRGTGARKVFHFLKSLSIQADGIAVSSGLDENGKRGRLSENSAGSDVKFW